VTNSNESPVKERLVRLRDQFDRDLRDSRFEVRHGMYLLNNEAVSSEGIESLNLLATLLRPGRRLAILSNDRPTFWDSLLRGMLHGFFGSVDGEAALGRFRDLAVQAYRAGTEFLEQGGTGYRLITPEHLAFSTGRGVDDLYWVLACYNLAWDHPDRLSYQVGGLSVPDDPALKRSGPPYPPFTDRPTFEGWGTRGVDLRLMASVSGVDDIPKEGRNLVIIANLSNLWYFRIFDGEGKVVADANETSLRAQAGSITDLKKQLKVLKKQLKSLRPPPRLTEEEKDRVINAVASIVGHTSGEVPEQPDPRKPTLPKGRHWLWLTHDLRFCSMEAIDLILGIAGATGRGKPRIRERLQCVETKNNQYYYKFDGVMIEAKYEPWLFIRAMLRAGDRPIGIKSIPGLEGVKIERVKAAIPKKIREHIFTDNKGSRLVDDRVG
jgi:hypothetical protein